MRRGASLCAFGCALAALALALGCTPGARTASTALACPTPAGAPTASEARPAGAAPAPAAAASAEPGQRLSLGPHPGSLALPPGRWAVAISVPPRRFVSLGVAGPQKALLRLDVVADTPIEQLRNEVRDDDRLLPTFVSFESPEAGASLRVVVDVADHVRLLLATADRNDIAGRSARDLKLGKVPPRALVGFPFPVVPSAGYVMESPHRYGFVRADVAAAMRAALEQTRIRYRRNLLAIGDCSQWNGARPASDLGKPRHISHEGGRDVDIALPTRDDEPSYLQRRCEGVLVEQTRLECSPGTVRGLDGERLAYFLGLLLDGPTPGGRHVPDPSRRPGPIAEVDTIFTDQAYIDEIRKALDELKRKRWIHDEAFAALGEDGLLRPSPWHVDHVHIRFRGETAAVPELLRFDPEPRPEENGRHP